MRSPSTACSSLTQSGACLTGAAGWGGERKRPAAAPPMGRRGGSRRSGGKGNGQPLGDPPGLLFPESESDVPLPHTPIHAQEEG